MNSCSIPGFYMKIDPDQIPLPEQTLNEQERQQNGLATLVIGGGCFWCTEAVFNQLDGVEQVVSGYCGGTEQEADYQSVCSGNTNHAEVIKVTYNPVKISYGELLAIFFSVAHDPTQLNRQGNDIGRQYRSVVFYQSEEEKQLLQQYIQQLQNKDIYHDPIQTSLEKLDHFYPAEAYHQNFAEQNPSQPYIQYISRPKIEKTQRFFTHKIKSVQSGNQS